MNSIELQKKLAVYGSSARELAEFMRVTPAGVRQWLNGERRIPGLAECIIYHLELWTFYLEAFIQNEVLEEFSDDYKNGFYATEEQNFEKYLKQFLDNPHPGNQLKQNRKWMGYTQRELSSQLKVSTIAIQQWESGKRKISPLLIRAMFFVSKLRFFEMVFGSPNNAINEIQALWSRMGERAKRNLEFDELAEENVDWIKKKMLPKLSKIAEIVYSESTSEIRPEIISEVFYLYILYRAAVGDKYSQFFRGKGRY